MQRFSALVAVQVLLAVVLFARPAGAQDTPRPDRQTRKPSIAEIRRQLDALDAARNKLNKKHLNWREVARLDSSFAPSFVRSDSAVVEVVYEADSTPILWTFTQSLSSDATSRNQTQDTPKKSLDAETIRLAQSTKSTSLIRLKRGDWNITLTMRSRDGRIHVSPPQFVHISGRRIYRLAFGEDEENKFRSVLRDKRRGMTTGFDR